MRTNGRTDMTKLVVAVRSFANAPKNWIEKVTNRADWEKCFRVAKVCIGL